MSEKYPLDLSKAFTQETSQDEQRQKRLGKILEEAMQYSPTAAKLISQAAGRGCKFELTDELDGCIGTYKYGNKTIYLNEKHPDAVLCTTAVHETRHAVQAQMGLSPQRNIGTLLTMWRATEADAMAFECAAAYEMRDDNPEAWFRFKRSHSGIAMAYSKEMKESKNQNKALCDSFKAWYDDASYIKGYDEEAVDFLEVNKEKQGSTFLKDNISGTQIAFSLCRNDGDLYLPDLVFLSSERARTVDSDIAKKCQYIADEALFLYGRKDKSIERLFVRSENGTVSSMKKPEQPMTASEKIKEQERQADLDIRDALPPWMQMKKGKGVR